MLILAHGPTVSGTYGAGYRSPKYTLSDIVVMNLKRMSLISVEDEKL